MARGAKVQREVKVKDPFERCGDVFLLELLLFDPQFPQKIPALHPRHQILSISMERGILENLAFRELSNILSQLSIVKGFKEDIGGSALGSITKNMDSKDFITLRDRLLVVEFKRLGRESYRVVSQRGDRIQKGKIVLKVKRSMGAH